MPPTREQQEAVDLHNKIRRETPGGSRPDLVWCDDLAAAAQKYANKLASTGNRAIPHDDQLVTGENLVMGSQGYADFPAAIKNWADEKKYYNGEPLNPSLSKGGKAYGHYTQIVWPETTRMGIALAHGGGITYVVARYMESQMAHISAWDTSDRGILDVIKKNPGLQKTVVKITGHSSSGKGSSKSSSLKRPWWKF